MKRRIVGLALAVAVGATAAHAGSSHAARAASGHAPGKAAAAAIAFARRQVGKPYLWGGTGPEAYDCSGLVMMAYRSAGVSIPRTSQQQWAVEHHVTSLQVGDLVFYRGYLAPSESPPGHVALYIGGGKIAEAYGAGVPVRVTALRPGAWGYANPAGAA